VARVVSRDRRFNGHQNFLDPNFNRGTSPETSSKKSDTTTSAEFR
jgi:hypothetical protein